MSSISQGVREAKAGDALVDYLLRSDLFLETAVRACSRSFRERNWRDSRGASGACSMTTQVGNAQIRNGPTEHVQCLKSIARGYYLVAFIAKLIRAGLQTFGIAVRQQYAVPKLLPAIHQIILEPWSAKRQPTFSVSAGGAGSQLAKAGVLTSLRPLFASGRG